jgi:hypothetical protein
VLSWLAALGIGVAVAALGYGAARPLPRLLAALRAVGATLVAALLLDAPLAPARPLAPWVALDASASWGADAARWQAARAQADSALAAGADSLLVFGDAVRGGALAPARPEDLASRIGDVVEMARAQGRPVVVVTDGRLDDPERLADLPQGSHVLLPAPEPQADVGLAPLELPAAALIGDTLEVAVLLRANAAVPGVEARVLTLSLGGRVLATQPVAPLPADGERELRLRVPVPALEGPQPLVAALGGADWRADNDTARATVVVAGAASVALISTSPDQDARFALAVLRDTQRGAVRGYWRVAPGQWREGDALRAVPEDAVRRALASASLVVLHGDTAYFGPARQRARGALVLMPSVGESEEYYATGAGESPLRAALTDLPFAELPPLRVGVAGQGAPALLVRRARRSDERAAVALREGSPRTAVVTAAGFWRWRTRGGRAAQSFDALWGSIFDWVADAAAPRRVADAAAARSQEILPRPLRVTAGAVGTAPVRDLAPRARGAWWLAALALLAFSAEWMLRRRIGWR